MRILIFGATGLLGTALCRHLADAHSQVMAFRRTAEQPCASEAQMREAFYQAIAAFQPDCVVNLIAATDVDDCERDVVHATLLNCKVPQLIVDACLEQKDFCPHIVHISSDQVYSGAGPHGEDVVNPMNVYALTKWVGEGPVLRAGGCVLRTNFFGRSGVPGRSSFSDWIVAAARAGTRLNVFDDVLFTPLGLGSLCSAIASCIREKYSGLYNLGSQSLGISKAEFAAMLLECLDLDTGLLNFVSVDTAVLTARRPKDMRMDSTRCTQQTSLLVPSINQEIENECRNYRVA